MKNEFNIPGGFPVLTDEERLLISRAAELSARSQNSAVASCFLSPREQRVVYECGKYKNAFFYGGSPGATRRKLIFLPAWINIDTECTDPLFSLEREGFFSDLLDSYGYNEAASEHIAVLKLCGSGYAQLSHRDWLGALTALGIKREMLGDICPFEGDTYLFCDPRAADFICNELKKAGRDTVRAESAMLPRDFKVACEYENINTTVASARLDGVVKALCTISREDSAALVTSGKVELNYFTETATDKKVDAKDIISVRGYGKFIILSASETNRRGRIRLLAKKYI